MMQVDIQCEMPSYKHEYLDARGRGEPIRWILAVAEQPYEDVRYNRETEWPARKPETPYGHVPVLHVNNKVISQSVAICRYLGKMHNLSVDDPWESAKGDEVADFVHDLLPPAGRMVYAKLAGKEEEFKTLATEFYSKNFPTYLKEFERRLEGREWFCGDKMTWVDVFAACYLSQYSAYNEGIFDTTPKVKSVIDKVLKLPQIVKWIKDRPVTPL